MPDSDTTGNPYFGMVGPISATAPPNAPTPPEAALMPVGSGSPVVADTQTFGPDGRPSNVDLSGVRVTGIEVVFRTAIDPVPNAVHAYIDIARADGHHQVIGGYPVGGFPQTGEGGQLTFEAGQERGKVPLAQGTLHAPRGETLTQYANELVAGAKAYNTHNVRYDGLGEDGFNSNAMVSSLIVAKGGAVGLRDVERIAKDIVDTSPVRTTLGRGPMDDKAETELIARDSHLGRYVCPGFGHASMSPSRFEAGSHDAPESPPALPQFGGSRIGAMAYVREKVIDTVYPIKDRLQTAIEKGYTKAAPDPTFPPFLAGDGVRIERGGHAIEVGPGYRASGTVLRVSNGSVVQRTGEGEVKYDLKDLTERAHDPAQLMRELQPGKRVDISIEGNTVEARPLPPVQQQRAHDRGLSLDVGR